VEDAFKQLWKNHLKLLLFEYKRGTGQEGAFLEECKNAFLQPPEAKQQDAKQQTEPILER
jgi:hypothetical protein